MPVALKETLFFSNKVPSKKIVITLRSQIETRRIYLILKRMVDIIFSLFVIIFILSWLLPILGVIIKLDSRGPILFIQKRVGFLGRTFHCIKLRTMFVNSVSDLQQATSDDPRITRVGKFLRITSFDELPQFFNVLMGEMSIVGPRPHMYKDNTDFAKLVENYRLRFVVKPGITGMAQVKGFRGPAKEFHSIFNRYQWDAFYVRNANSFLDFKIVKETILQVFKSIFSFKIEEKQVDNASGLAFAGPIISE
jgi:putative colanic acid biosysnthesis UDP-glucose lipid carrier transferase